MLYNQYIVEGLLGKGGFGIVYDAVEATGNRQVALKVCIRGASGSLLEDMKREFELIKKLAHKNIVRVFDFIAIEGSDPAIVMELAPGGSLKQRLLKNRFRLYETAVRDYAAGALRGLACLHSSNILHCDIKPDNILLSGSTVKLCDFGISMRCAVSSADGHQTRHLLGSPLYMAPEIFKDQTYTQASDMWALGCTLVELASGKNPWADVAPPAGTPSVAVVRSLVEFFSGQTYDPATVVPGYLTAPLRELLCRMLQLDPTKRPTALACLESPYFDEGDAWTHGTGMELAADYRRLISEAQAKALPIVETAGAVTVRVPDSNTISTAAVGDDVETNYLDTTGTVSVALPSTILDKPHPRRMRLPVHAVEELRRPFFPK